MLTLAETTMMWAASTWTQLMGGHHLALPLENRILLSGGRNHTMTFKETQTRSVTYTTLLVIWANRSLEKLSSFY